MPCFSELGDSKNNILLCVCVVLVLVLLSHLSKQEYKSSCDRRVDAAMYYTPRTSSSQDIKTCAMNSISNYNNAITRKIAMRKKPEPELDIIYEHTLGQTLDNVRQKTDDPLSLDGILQKNYLETTTDQINRSFSIGDTNGPELEGMSAPIDQFERDAMKRQLNKRMEIYGNQELSGADALSKFNL